MKNTRILRSLCSTLGAVVLLTGLITTARAGSEIALSAGQTVYVPIYSHIYSGLKGNPLAWQPHSASAIPTPGIRSPWLR